MKISLSGTGATVQLGGTLNKPCKEIGLFYFDDLDVKADHVLAQGIKMGGCESVLLNSYVAAGGRWGLDAKESGVYVYVAN